ncbi:hypothetical protein CARUB_v10000012mg, partial [Capsella rubella]
CLQPHPHFVGSQPFYKILISSDDFSPLSPLSLFFVHLSSPSSCSLSSPGDSTQAFFSEKMNHCNLQQNAFMSREEMMGFDRKDLVVCPKPRRVGLLANNVIRPLRLHMSQAAADLCDSKAGAELLDIIRRKEDNGTIGQLLSSSPPYFPGSPPSRAVNPLAQDARFRAEKLNPTSPNSPFLQPSSATGFPSPSSSSSSSSSSRGCVRMKFGLNSPAVRVEGFDCLNRDRQNSSIPAMA